jgi:ABC-type lipoprotein export system ATPase subunit
VTYPPILLADEPTPNLDSEAGISVLEQFRDRALREERALLIVNRDPNIRTIAEGVLQAYEGLLLES